VTLGEAFYSLTLRAWYFASSRVRGSLLRAGQAANCQRRTEPPAVCATRFLRGDVQAVEINRVIITQMLSVLFIEVRP
jgi:hypothetical protein